MTKFLDMPESERSALVDLHKEFLRMKSEEDHDLGRLGVRVFFLANAAGAAALVTFMGILVQVGKNYEPFTVALVLFLCGAACAALLQMALMSASTNAVHFLGTQLEEFVRGRKDVEELRPFRLNGMSKNIIRCLLLSALVLFLSGVWKAFVDLRMI